SASEVQFFGHGQEATQMSQLHVSVVRHWYTGCWRHRASTCSRTRSRAVVGAQPPASRASSTSHTQPASCSQSATPKPRVVTAGVPMRNPEVTKGERGSLGTEFLFAVM